MSTLGEGYGTTFRHGPKVKYLVGGLRTNFKKLGLSYIYKSCAPPPAG